VTGARGHVTGDRCHVTSTSVNHDDVISVNEASRRKDASFHSRDSDSAEADERINDEFKDRHEDEDQQRVQHLMRKRCIQERRNLYHDESQPEDEGT